MTIKHILRPVALVATFALAAAPAFAGQRRGGGSRGGGRSQGGVTRGPAQGRSAPVYRGSVGVRGGPRGIVGGSRFYGSYYRPYYSFRPRLSLGFGLWSGYPFAYPYYYAYPYGYSYPYPVDPYSYGYAAPSYGYPVQPYSGPNQPSAYPPANDPSSGSPDPRASGPGSPAPQQPGPSVGVQQGAQQSAPGGVSFDITPDNAAVFVDGTYIGTAGTFGPAAQPLGLISGRHHIEIRASGYRTMTFDADVVSGEVTPYRGTLQRD